MLHKPAETIKVADVILPPERELRLWMRRTIKQRGLSDAALHLTVFEIYEGNSDKRGRWLIVRCHQTKEWSTNQFPFSFKVRPETPWPFVGEAVS